ncbi:hypothetical protein AGLY_000007 [Aphis glycines]|uniref:Uncharacterized protein n=1 Tax=Aphis glycines TaxID=307491 RepID=A0A6G0U8B8_APHGL|nr:hypothetical protein AGLY_000007 [Aphis glycines]
MLFLLIFIYNRFFFFSLNLLIYNTKICNKYYNYSRCITHYHSQSVKIDGFANGSDSHAKIMLYYTDLNKQIYTPHTIQRNVTLSRPLILLFYIILQSYYSTHTDNDNINIIRYNQQLNIKYLHIIYYKYSYVRAIIICMIYEEFTCEANLHSTTLVLKSLDAALFLTAKL